MAKKKKKIEYGNVDIPAEQFEPRNTKVRITMFVDGDVLDAFKAESTALNKGYQTLINEKLREILPTLGKSAEQRLLEAIFSAKEVVARFDTEVRKIVREEVKKKVG